MKTKVSRGMFASLRAKFSAAAVIAASVVLVGAYFVPALQTSVLADSFQDQIDALNAKNADTRGLVQGLQAQAASYQDAINQLQAQIDGIQASIDANEAQQASLQQQIIDAQNQIDQQRAFLASDVKAMYVDGTPSTLEVLANSKNLSDFVDKQEYRTSVQNKLQDTLAKIAELQKELQTKKAQVDQLLTEEHDQQDQLSGARAQQASLLSYNEGQQSAYNAQIKANSTQIAQLRAQQAAANSRLGSGVVSGDPGHGGYPAKWDYPVPQDSLVDSWGMYNRECVSYTAWKVYETYGYMPYWGGQGNANQWPGDAVRAGIPTGSTPRAQSVAIWNVGAFGHAMWVEAVNSDGSLWISQYNYDVTGHYSEMRVSPSMAASLTYIYFQ
ncbi:MAG TPA: CHAP domain-containing protein [Candidatus Saccharimonadales bacterium]|nr:CHAP domain-containing protein [Candidatus Saccharimonadales bacterium]